MRKFQTFVDKHALEPAHRELSNVGEHTPLLICAWIKYHCGKPRSEWETHGNIDEYNK